MVALAILYHDPEGQLIPLITRTLPTIAGLFDDIAICASPQASRAALRLWQTAGARVEKPAFRCADGFNPAGSFENLFWGNDHGFDG